MEPSQLYVLHHNGRVVAAGSLNRDIKSYVLSDFQLNLSLLRVRFWDAWTTIPPVFHCLPHPYALNTFWSSVTSADSLFCGLYLSLVVPAIFFWNYFSPGFGGSFMAPSPSPVTPAQNNLLQPNFEGSFGTTPSTSSSSSFDPFRWAVIFQIFFLFVLFLNAHLRV